MQNTWNILASDSVIAKMALELNKNNFETIIVNTKEEAKQKALELLPHGAEVMNMTSRTLDAIGVSEEIVSSGKYNSVRNTLTKMDRKKDSLAMQKLGSAPDYSIGSVHAVTEDGHVLIASKSGSQLPGYVYGSSHVIWIVGAQKIVKNIAEGIKRVDEYVLPLESIRVKKVYGMDQSEVMKLLIYNKEANPGRVTMILVKESLGF